MSYDCRHHTRSGEGVVQSGKHAGLQLPSTIATLNNLPDLQHFGCDTVKSETHVPVRLRSNHPFRLGTSYLFSRRTEVSIDCVIELGAMNPVIHLEHVAFSASASV